MTQSMYNDMNVVGIGTFEGGIYDRVRIDGVAFVNGAIQCERLSCNGTGKLKGIVTAKSIDVNGMASFGSHVHGQQTKVCGRATVDGELIGERLEVEGSVSVSTQCEFKTIDVRGRLSVDHDLRTEQFHTKGSFRVGNQLSAGLVHVDLNGKCEAREMRAQKIEVVLGNFKKHSLLGAMFKTFGHEPILEAAHIEGESIKLEHTNASLVRGQQVIIGPGCQIRRVEYSTDIYIDPSSIVHECVQV